MSGELEEFRKALEELGITEEKKKEALAKEFEEGLAELAKRLHNPIEALKWLRDQLPESLRKKPLVAVLRAEGKKELSLEDLIKEMEEGTSLGRELLGKTITLREFLLRGRLRG